MLMENVESKSSYPNNLLNEYKLCCEKLKKAQTAIFKRLAPNLHDIESEFAGLARKFDNGCLFEYAAQSWQKSAFCHKLLKNELMELDSLLNTARCFLKADKEYENTAPKGLNSNTWHDAAWQNYGEAMKICDKEEYAVIKAGIIREMAEEGKNVDQLTSTFDSPCHRFFDLELQAKDRIFIKDYYSALDKLTEIYDDIIERKKEFLYSDLLKRNEITRLLLLLVLQLPKCRMAPSNVKLIEKYTWCDNENAKDYSIPEMFLWNITQKDVDDLKEISKNQLLLESSGNSVERCSNKDPSNCDCIAKSGGYSLEYLKKYVDMTSRDVGIPEYDSNIYGPVKLVGEDGEKNEETEIGTKILVDDCEKASDPVENPPDISKIIFGEPEEEIFPEDWGKGIPPGLRKYYGTEDIHPEFIEKFNDYHFGSYPVPSEVEEETYYCDFTKMFPPRTKRNLGTPVISKQVTSSSTKATPIKISIQNIEISSDSSTDTLKELSDQKIFESLTSEAESLKVQRTPAKFQKSTLTPKKGKRELAPRLKFALKGVEELKNRFENQKDIWRDKDDKSSLLVDLNLAVEGIESLNTDFNRDLIKLYSRQEQNSSTEIEKSLTISDADVEGLDPSNKEDDSKKDQDTKSKKSGIKKNGSKSAKKKDTKTIKNRKITIVEEYPIYEKTPKHTKVDFPNTTPESLEYTTFRGQKEFATPPKIEAVPNDLKLVLEALVYACTIENDDCLREVYNHIYKYFAFADLNKEQDFLLDKLLKKHWPH